MSKKTFWSESFRNRLNSSKDDTFMKSKENFQNKNGEENEIEETDKDDENEKNLLEMEMIKRLKEEYKKKKKRMEMENYKHIELMENIEDSEKVPNINLHAVQKLVDNFSSLSNKLKKLNQRTKTEDKKEDENTSDSNKDVG